MTEEKRFEKRCVVTAGDMARMALLMTRLPDGLDIGDVLTHKRLGP